MTTCTPKCPPRSLHIVDRCSPRNQWCQPKNSNDINLLLHGRCCCCIPYNYLGLKTLDSLFWVRCLSCFGPFALFLTEKKHGTSSMRPIEVIKDTRKNGKLGSYHLSHEKNTRILSIESWLFNRDRYHGLLQSLYN